MSASGVRELLATPAGVIQVARLYAGVELTESEARMLTLSPNADSWGWQRYPHATSAAPVIWLKNRMQERNIAALEATAEDDSLPLTFVKRRGKEFLSICNVARSKIFRTTRIVEPIDLTAFRVALKSECFR